jgi:hypothetical protein
MVHDDVWRASGLAEDGGMLCVSCLEARLGRKLRQSDFPDWSINRRVLQRLADRIGAKACPGSAEPNEVPFADRV